jgi:hypothetical protein
MMRTDIVAYQMNCPDGLSNLPVQVFQEGDAFLLPFAVITLSIDPARTGIKGGKEVAGVSAFVLARIPVGQDLRLRWLGRGWSRTRRHSGLLIQRGTHLVIAEWPRVAIDQVGDSGIKFGSPSGLGIQPEMMAPRCQLVHGQDPADGCRREVRHEPVRDELLRQFGSVALREATAEQIGAFAGQAHDVPGDRRGKPPVAPRPGTSARPSSRWARHRLAH